MRDLRIVGRLLLLIALLATAALGACGGEGDGEGGAEREEAAAQLAVPWLNPDGEFPVVGSLAVNPADDTLWMATNTGLFRVPAGGKAPVKVTGTITSIAAPISRSSSRSDVPRVGQPISAQLSAPARTTNIQMTRR